MAAQASIQYASVTSADGARIGYQTVGAGPGLIVIPGALSVAADFEALASALADRFTVTTIERRGRGQSGPLGVDYSIAKELEDIAAVQAQTGAAFLFGHSYGGLIALEAARNNPDIRKVAVYEPGVSIDGSIATGWMPAYESALAAGQPLDAFVAFARASGPAFMRHMPTWYLRFIMRRVIPKHEWLKMEPLLPANLIEHRELARLDNSYAHYREVSADALLMSGGKSPAFRRQTLETLASVLPHAQIQTLPGLNHFGPTTEKPAQVADALKSFLLRQ